MQYFYRSMEEAVLWVLVLSVGTVLNAVADLVNLDANGGPLELGLLDQGSIL